MLNNKGMTLVELLVTFSLLLVIVVGMFNLIMDVKFELDERQIAKDFTEYSSVINNEIHYDLLMNKPFAIAYKNKSSDDWICKTSFGSDCEKSSGNNGYIFKTRIGDQEKTSAKLYDNLKDECSNIYPCAVYAYKSGTEIAFQSVGLNIGGSNNGLNEDEKVLLEKHGIKYKGFFESIPDQDFVEIRNVVISGEEDLPDPDISIEITSSGVFVINFPFYLIENDKNYGFKIAYPFYQIETVE